MRKAALNSAILAKMQDSDLLVVDGLAADAPKTKKIVALLKNLQINRRCLLTLADRDRNLYLSARNIADVTVRIAAELRRLGCGDAAEDARDARGDESDDRREAGDGEMKNDIYTVLIRPLVTEKGTHQSQTNNAYAFEVAPEANKARSSRRWRRFTTSAC